MCGRYTLVASVEDLIQEFALTNVPEFAAGSNISPTETCLVVRANESHQREAELMRWGFPSHTGKLLINARAETAHKKSTFAQSFQNRRCLVPARGFYEWRSEHGKKRPYCFGRPGGRLLAFAGLWQPFEGECGRPLNAFTILTTEASELVAGYHDRMPAIISPEQYSSWLTPQAEVTNLLSLLDAPAAELSVWACDPLAPSRDAKVKSSQPTLFDLNPPTDESP